MKMYARLAAVVLLLSLQCLCGQLVSAETSPEYEAHTYIIRNESDYECMSIKLGAFFSVPYVGKEQNETAGIALPSPENATEVSVSGECPKTYDTTGTATAVVQFGTDKAEEFKMTLVYNSTASSGSGFRWHVSQVAFRFSLSDKSFFPNSEYIESHTVTASPVGISASSGRSYKCSAQSTVALKSSDSSREDVTMIMKNVLIDPFMSGGNNGETCAADNEKHEVNKIVPIAVGCALAALLLIVVVAWVVGRRSSRSGYKEV